MESSTSLGGRRLEDLTSRSFHYDTERLLYETPPTIGWYSHGVDFFLTKMAVFRSFPGRLAFVDALRLVEDRSLAGESDFVKAVRDWSAYQRGNRRGCRNYWVVSWFDPQPPPGAPKVRIKGSRSRSRDEVEGTGVKIRLIRRQHSHRKPELGLDRNGEGPLRGACRPIASLRKTGKSVPPDPG